MMTPREIIAGYQECARLVEHDYDDQGVCRRCTAVKDGARKFDQMIDRIAAVRVAKGLPAKPAVAEPDVPIDEHHQEP